MSSRWVENPPHVDQARMRHITDRHLLESADLSARGLENVARATGDVDAAFRAWRGYRAGGAAPVPVEDIGRWAQRRAARPDAAPADRVLRNPDFTRHFLGSRGGGGGFRNAADELLHTDIDFLDASRGRSSFYGFHYLYWLRPLLEAYALTGEPKYAARYGELFDQWYDVRDQVVGDWPGLDVVWYSLGVWARSAMFNQVVSLLSAEPAFTDQQWRRTMKCLLGGARWAAEEHATFRQGNWQLASVSQLLHTAETFPEFAERDEWREVGRVRVEDHLELDFYADGGHFERAPSYHTMCMQALHVAVLSADPEQWPLIEHPRLKAAHQWLADMVHPTGWLPHVQDSHISRPADVLLVGHYLYGEPTWKWLVERFMEPAQIADRLEKLGPRAGDADPIEEFHAAASAEPARRSLLLTTSGYAMLRQGWAHDGCTTTVNLGPYVGHELEPHSHHASLDFVISGWGEPLAWEAGGPPTYDDPEYYDWFQAGRGHNTVLLEGEPNSAERNTAVDAFWTLGADDRSGVDVVCGRHDAFTQRHSRRIVFVRSDPSYWLIVDDLGGEPIDSTWILHGRSPWQAQGERRFVSSSSPGLAVLPAAAPSRVEFGEGRARMPRCQIAQPADVDEAAVRERRETPDEYGIIHGLNLGYGDGLIHTVVVPFEHDVPSATVELAGGGVHVRLGPETDSVSDVVEPRGWLRVYDDGRTEQAQWDLDPDRSATGSARGLTAGATPACSGRGVLAWWGHTGPAGVEAEVVTDRRAMIVLQTAGTVESTTVNGVAVPVAATDDTCRVTVPSAGRWTIRAIRHA